MSKRFKLAVVSVSTLLVSMLLLGTMLGHGADTNPADPYRHINVFTEVYSRIKGEYVEEPDMKNVTLGAINGLLVSLDPFASYLNADQYKQYQKAKETPKANVGLLLSRKYGNELSIVDALPGSPADKAGLATGDLVEAINGISTRDMPLAYADVLLQGDAGSEIELTVLRLRKPEPTKMMLARAVIKNPPLATKMVDGETGLIRISSLEAGKVTAVAQAIADLQKQGAKKLVVDLRHCATNEPAEGVALANLFLDKGTIGSLSGQKVPKKVFEADPAKQVFKGSMVVLTNRGTAGGAEVAAAALLDNKRAQVVGERTYGEASLRKAIGTEDGGAVLLAVAKYYAPSGKAIQDTSVVPSVAVADVDLDGDDDDSDAAAKPAATPAAPKTEDEIMKKGLEVLQKGLPETAAKTAAGATTKEPEKILTPLGIPKPQ